MRCMEPSCDREATRAFTRRREGSDPLRIFACQQHLWSLVVLQASFGAVCTDFLYYEASVC